MPVCAKELALLNSVTLDPFVLIALLLNMYLIDARSSCKLMIIIRDSKPFCACQTDKMGKKTLGNWYIICMISLAQKDLTVGVGNVVAKEAPNPVVN